jgi:hypothetical protein
MGVAGASGSGDDAGAAESSGCGCRVSAAHRSVPRGLVALVALWLVALVALWLVARMRRRAAR